MQYMWCWYRDLTSIPSGCSATSCWLGFWSNCSLFKFALIQPSFYSVFHAKLSVYTGLLQEKPWFPIKQFCKHLHINGRWTWFELIVTEKQFCHVFANSMWHVSLKKKKKSRLVAFGRWKYKSVGVRDKESFLFILPWNRLKEKQFCHSTIKNNP